MSLRLRRHAARPRPALNAETFTGADGASWPSPWVAAGTGTVALLSNAGRLSPPTGAYAQTFAYRPAPNDGEVLLRFQWPNTASLFDIIARGQTHTGNPKWRCRIGESGIEITDGTVTQASSPTLTAGVWRWARLRWQGSTVQVRVWTSGSTEPSTWDVSATDAAGPTSGNLLLASTNLGDGASLTVLVDDLSVTTL